MHDDRRRADGTLRRHRRGRARHQAGAAATGGRRGDLGRGLALIAGRGTSRRAYLGIGSNVGDRLAYLNGAVAKLDGAEGVHVVRSSSVYETEPVGEITDQPDFYNAVTEVDTTLDPHALLARCKSIERELGRQPGGPRHGPRPIDVDLLLVDGVTTADEQLVLPHPEVTSRRFVLAPLLELEPDLALPDGTRLVTALAALGSDQRATPVAQLG